MSNVETLLDEYSPDRWNVGTLLASLFGLRLPFAFLLEMPFATGQLDHLRTAGTSMGKPSPRHIRYSASCRISNVPQAGVSARIPA
jgi:hypothetical protein